MADEGNRLSRGVRRVIQRPGALVALVGGAGGGLLALGLALAQKDPVSRCPGPHNAVAAPLDLVFVGFCAASFLAGGLISDLGQDDAAEDAPQSEGDRTWLQAIVVIVLAILFGLLAYETYSLVLLDAHPDSSLWPITWFVRCLSTITTVATIGSLVVVCIICAFAGKWLWYRPRTLTSGRPNR